MDDYMKRETKMKELANNTRSYLQLEGDVYITRELIEDQGLNARVSSDHKSLTLIYKEYWHPPEGTGVSVERRIHFDEHGVDKIRALLEKMEKNVKSNELSQDS